MNILSRYSLLFITVLAPAMTWAAPLQILWGNFAARDSVSVLESELSYPTLSGFKPTFQTSTFPLSRNMNPFLITPEDFFVGTYLPYPEDPTGEPPLITPESALWFTDLLKNNRAPDVFIIGGHQVISEGWHDHAESRFMFLPTLLKTLELYPEARAVFSHVKLAILFGCNTLTNLEPHFSSKEFGSIYGQEKREGAYLSSDEIRRAYFSSPQGRRAVIGTPEIINSLEFYKARLSREYGPGSPHYEYTRSRAAENCKGPEKYERCGITNVDRIFPESGLFDGTHRYNYPFLMKRIFPNATLVLGFSSASPSDSLRAVILKTTLNRARSEINQELKGRLNGSLQNILQPLIDESVGASEKETIIKAIRRQWTLATYQMNRNRPSGSITPAFPAIDNDGVFAAQVGGAPLFAPYEDRAPTTELLRIP